jgi:hypothetical protein
LDASIAWLSEYAAMGLTRDVLRDPNLAPLRGQPAFARVVDRLAENARAVRGSTLAFKLTSAELVAEDIAYDDATRTFFVSSVRRRKIVSVAADGTIKDLTRDGQDGTWSMMGLAIDPKRRLMWATTAALKEAANYDSSDAGKTALVAYDLGSGKLGQLVTRIDLAAGSTARALTDITLSRAGDVIVSDSASGVLYGAGANARALEPIVGEGTFVSPQTPAITPDEASVVVPDYVRGLAVVDRATHAVRWLTHARDVALSGFDGVYFESPTTLLAVQNGTTPARIVRLHLDDALTQVERLEVVEQSTPGLGAPTHGVVVSPAGRETERAFYFIANSGWDQLQEDGSVKAGGLREPAEVRRVAMPRAR